MNTVLRTRIEQLRKVLENDPASIVAGEIRPPCSNSRTGILLWDQFLTEANGGRFGSIDLWSTDELGKNQFYTSQMPGGSNVWLVVGQILYEPLAVCRVTNDTVVYPQNGEAQNLGGIDHFLSHYAFGEGYSKIIPNGEQDEWWQILHTNPA